MATIVTLTLCGHKRMFQEHQGLLNLMDVLDWMYLVDDLTGTCTRIRELRADYPVGIQWSREGATTWIPTC